MNNDKQLTPEEILNPFIKLVTTGFGKYPIVDQNKAIIAMQQWAAQQTAAEDEEIRQLKEWKKEQIKTFAPLLDYGQSPESGIQIGRSIVEASIAALKSQKVKDERLKELEEEAEAWSKDEELALLNNSMEQKGARIKELEYAERMMIKYKSELDAANALLLKRDTEKDARIAELEKLIIDISEDFKLKLSGYQTIEKQLLEKVEQLIEAREKDEQGYNEIILRLKAERDHAFDLLAKWVDLLPSLEFDSPMLKIEHVIAETKTLISSRENKKPSNIPLEYPGKSYQALFDYLSQHGFIPLNQDMHEIIDIVHEIDRAFKE